MAGGYRARSYIETVIIFVCFHGYSVSHVFMLSFALSSYAMQHLKKSLPQMKGYVVVGADFAERCTLWKHTESTVGWSFFFFFFCLSMPILCLLPKHAPFPPSPL